MKRLFFIFFATMAIVFVSCGRTERRQSPELEQDAISEKQNLQPQNPPDSIVLNQTEIDKIIAITAYWMNKQCVDENSAAYKDVVDEFQSPKCPFSSVVEIKALLLEKNYSKNHSFTKELEKVAEKSPTTSSEIVVFFSKTIFDTANYKKNKIDRPKSIIEYIKKRGDDLGKVEENIKSDIAQYIQSRQEKREDAREEVPPTPKPEEETSSGGFLLPIVTLVLFALLMACIVFFYIRMWLPMDRKVHDLKVKLKDTKSRLSDLDDRLNALKRDHSNLKSEKEELDNELRQLSRKQKSTPTEYESTHQPSKPANCDFYAGIPTNGSFEVRDSYKPGNSIYVLHTSGNSGTFELVQRDEVLRIVRKSRTSYIEPACNILSESEVFSNVKTEKPGRVCLDGDRWRIVEKASVRLV